MASIFQRGNVNSLYSVLKYNIQNPEEIKKASVKARDYAIRKFDLIKIAREHEKLYSSLIN
jgi:hypothetical protein